MTDTPTIPPALDTLTVLDSLTAIHARAVELTGIAHGLDLLAVEVGDSKSLRFAFAVLSRLVAERCIELELALDSLAMKKPARK